MNLFSNRIDKMLDEAILSSENKEINSTFFIEKQRIFSKRTKFCHFYYMDKNNCQLTFSYIEKYVFFNSKGRKFHLIYPEEKYIFQGSFMLTNSINKITKNKRFRFKQGTIIKLRKKKDRFQLNIKGEFDSITIEFDHIIPENFYYILNKQKWFELKGFQTYNGIVRYQLSA